MSKLRAVLVCVVMMMMCATAHAQAVPDYGYQWSTITHAGNRMANAQEAPRWHDPAYPDWFPTGQVNYEYRIAQTNVTCTDYMRFLEAYKPYMSFNERITPIVTTILVDYNHTTERFQLRAPIYARVAAESVPWLMAARYANWLHNDQALTQDAFNLGAYDLRSITNYLGDWNGIIPHRLPGAKFWIPSMDELIKATYYDPNRYGPGQEGYWKYTHGSDTRPVYNYPEFGGQSDASIPFDVYDSFRYDEVDAYPAGRTPWGLYGMSGGVSEFSDSFHIIPSGDMAQFVARFESSTGPGIGYESFDLLELCLGFDTAYSVGAGFRLASVVPAPSCVYAVFVACMCGGRRKRRACQAVM